jgi:hypothetical protein
MTADNHENHRHTKEIPMHRSRHTGLVRCAAAALLTLTALLAACTNYDPRNEPTVAPSTPAPTAAPTQAPTETPAGPIGSAHVVLAVATANRVTIDVTDASGTLTAATSGTPGDGATVEAYKLVVTNLTPTSLRLTWLGGPCDATNTLAVDAGRRRLLLVQKECPGDAIATDRILDLEFSTPVKATDLEAFLQDGLDT